VADRLAKRGYTVVVTGTAEELGLIQAMTARMQAHAMVMAGRTQLGTLAVLMRGARLLVANDTGVSHIAAALQLPSVIICIGSDPVRWGPLNRMRHRLLAGSMATTDSVWEEAKSLLDHDVGSSGRVSDGDGRRSAGQVASSMTVGAVGG
jgi:ADP-heptose:LPS heptosyltransferase